MLKQLEELAFLIASIFIFVGSFLAQITIWASKRTDKSEALTSSKANSSNPGCYLSYALNVARLAEKISSRRMPKSRPGRGAK